MAHPSKSAYGGAGRHVILQVVDRKGDPEQAGRLRVRAVGYQDDKGGIPDDQLHWARMIGPGTNPQDGGLGGPLTGATENSYMIGFYLDGDQQKPMIIGSIGKSGEDQKGEGELNQQGRKHDLNRHSRDKEKGGGDFRYASDKKDYDQESVTDYGKNKSENPYGKKKGKEVDEDEKQNHSIAEYAYA